MSDLSAISGFCAITGAWAFTWVCTIGPWLCKFGDGVWGLGDVTAYVTGLAVGTFVAVVVVVAVAVAVVVAGVVVRKNIFRIPLKKPDLAVVVTGGASVLELFVIDGCVERIKLCPISAFAYDNCWQTENSNQKKNSN